jgi:membrane protein
VADYLALIVLMPISINLAFAASVFLTNPTLASKFQLLIPFIWLQTLVLKLVPVFFFTLTFYIIYIFFPNTKVHTAPALLGAFLAAIFWFVVQNLYIGLQIGVSNYNAIFGSFAPLPLFLIWIYLGWLFVLGGAQIAYACQNRKSYILLPTPSEPSVRLSAAFDIMDSVQKAFSENTRLTMSGIIARQPDYTAALVQEVAERLIAAGALYISKTEDRLLPAGPVNIIDHRRIIEIILGTSTADTPGGKSSRQAIQAAAAYTSSVLGSPERESTEGNLQDGPSSM